MSNNIYKRIDIRSVLSCRPHFKALTLYYGKVSHRKSLTFPDLRWVKQTLVGYFIASLLSHFTVLKFRTSPHESAGGRNNLSQSANPSICVGSWSWSWANGAGASHPRSHVGAGRSCVTSS